MHRRLGSATLSQLAFPGESYSNFPWENPKGTIQLLKKKALTTTTRNIITEIMMILALTNMQQQKQQHTATTNTAAAAPQWGAADAEIKVPSGENTELKHSPFQAWSRSVYSHTCYAYCQGILPCLFLPFQFIHRHFFPKPLPIFSCVGLQNKIGHPAGCRFPC